LAFVKLLMSVNTSSKILLLLFFGGYVQAAPVTNLQLIETTFADYFEMVLQRVDLPDSVTVVSTDTELIQQIAERQLVETLNRYGVQRVFESRTLPDSLASVTLNVLQQKIRYEKAKKKTFKRKSSIDLFIKIVSPDQEILLSQTAQHAVQDTIKKSDINRVENPRLEFTVGNRPTSLWLNIVEPVAVSLVTGMIIYSFYTFRSR